MTPRGQGVVRAGVTSTGACRWAWEAMVVQDYLDRNPIRTADTGRRMPDRRRGLLHYARTRTERYPRSRRPIRHRGRRVIGPVAPAFTAASAGADYTNSAPRDAPSRSPVTVRFRRVAAAVYTLCDRPSPPGPPTWVMCSCSGPLMSTQVTITSLAMVCISAAEPFAAVCTGRAFCQQMFGIRETGDRAYVSQGTRRRANSSATEKFRRDEIDAVANVNAGPTRRTGFYMYLLTNDGPPRCGAGGTV